MHKTLADMDKNADHFTVLNAPAIVGIYKSLEVMSPARHNVYKTLTSSSIYKYLASFNTCT
jgi:hypothetical protein